MNTPDNSRYTRVACSKNVQLASHSKHECIENATTLPAASAKAPPAHQQMDRTTSQLMTESTSPSVLALTFEDLQLAGELVELRLAPGSGEADRVARVRRLLDTSADLNYAVSTYTHRLLVYAGRRPAYGGLRDDTIALQDALEGFANEVRAVANAYRALHQTRPSA